MPRHRTFLLSAFWCGVAVFALMPRAAFGVPVKLRAVEASVPAAEGHPLAAAVDGVLSPNNGWSIREGQFQPQFAVFAPDKPLSASVYRLEFFFLDPRAASYLVNFGVSVTTDEKPTLKSRWDPLVAAEAFANFTNQVRITGRTVRPGASPPGLVVTLHARAPFKGITGFRLRLNLLGGRSSGHPPSIGHGPDGNFLLTELEVEAEPLRSSNIALGLQVYGSGTVPAEFPKQNLTDGLISTYSYHANPGPSNYFTLDLGRRVALDHLVVRGRRDGGESNLLGNYRVEIMVESGDMRETRIAQWQSQIRRHRPHPSGGNADLIYERDGEGAFSGRAIRIHEEPGHTLQIAELEVYPSLSPQAQGWLADGFPFKVDGEVAVPPGSQKLAFTITVPQEGVVASILTYRWRVPGWVEQWREAGEGGRVEWVPPPPPGHFELQMQARHTDGVWDAAIESLGLSVARLWWKDPLKVGAGGGTVAILAATAWWWVYAWRMKRRLALAERHLELQRERLRIARDMHDEIGARLTYIALLADRTRREGRPPDDAPDGPLQRLADSARSAVAALDNIVWAVNPQHDTVGSLADYLCDYAPTYLQAAGIECRLGMQVACSERPLDLTARHGLLMATKEALQNAVKHSQANTVWLGVQERDGELEISIRDNGRGVADHRAGLDQSGMNNMRQRLAELGGECEIVSAPDQPGTCVFFRLVLKRSG
jgi:signal transduction histidine kinase